MTLGEIIDDVLTRIEEETGSPSRWSRSDARDSINDGLDELSDATEFYERTAVFTLRARAVYHDVRTVGDEPFLRVSSIYNPARSRWIDATNVRDLDDFTSRQWIRNDGEPDQWFMRGLWWLGIYPRSRSQDSVLHLKGKALHPHMTDETERPRQLPEEYHRTLVEYAVYDLLARDDETAKALEHFSEFEKMSRELDKRVANRTQIPMRGHFGTR